MVSTVDMEIVLLVEFSVDSLNDGTPLNGIDMSNIDAEYEALCEGALV